MDENMASTFRGKGRRGQKTEATSSNNGRGLSLSMSLLSLESGRMDSKTELQSPRPGTSGQSRTKLGPRSITGPKNEYKNGINQRDNANMTLRSLAKGQAARPAKPCQNSRGRQENTTVSGRRRGENTATHQDANAKNVPRRNNRNTTNQANPKAIPHSEIFKNTMSGTDLTSLAESDAIDIVLKLTNAKTEFINTIDSPGGSDQCVLLMRIIAKVCTSPSEHKTNVLLKICNSQYPVALLSFLVNLPFAVMKRGLYWRDQQRFWENFVLFMETITNLSPSTSFLKCRALIDNCSKSCLELLHHRHGFELHKELATKLVKLRQRLTHLEHDKKAQNCKKRMYQAHDTEGLDPPDDFRFLSVVPTSEDLKESTPFVRPNVVQGSYQHVEHYLDVQFRLLREDCFGPLREGIDQYIRNPHKKTYDNIRVFPNVRIVSSYVTRNKIGVIIKLDDFTMKQFRAIKWDQTKRFIYGGLLLLTSDNGATFIAATVLDQDKKLLRKGMIPVSIMDDMGESDNTNLRTDVTYTMFESEIYYQPYLLALKVLQGRTFPKHLAMSKYIIDLHLEPEPPAYLDTNTTYTVKTEQSRKTFTVLDPSTWPTKEELGLNESQYEAYQLALTNELTVVQGPPGTGKTFLAGKVAETLLYNGQYPMLVICYTNHALDQFLEAILRKTNSIVRVGGQSRNEAMADYNLIALRKKVELCKHTKTMLWELKIEVIDAIDELKTVQDQIGRFNSEIWKYDYLTGFNQESKLLGTYYKYHNIEASDPLEHWLFEGHVDYMDDVDAKIEEMMEQFPIERQFDEESLPDSFSYYDIDIEDTLPCYDDILFPNTSFSIDNAEQQFNFLLDQCKKASDSQTQYDTLIKVFELQARIQLYEDMKVNWTKDCQLVVNENTNLSMLPTKDRWLLYYRWARDVLHYKQMETQVLQANVQEAIRRDQRARMSLDLNILRRKKVIGMTTSGAARLRELLIDLGPKIVIVEEAAEVLEQHIITSLTKNCEHLILIGDHQQLRPSASYIKLARQFNLEVSLFERMIINGVRSRRLSVQHRMRPEISALITPHIYRDLENHPSVETFPDVRGMIDNLFFMTHNYYEEEMIQDGGSRSNYKEAELVLKLADYLMKQGYESDEVTILTPYSGQVLYMIKERNNRAEYSSFLSKVHITTVDNYQGEESKIILLSLVRNNNQGKIGFVGITNRVCVALSRAREGFYIFGNVKILKDNSTLWKNIIKTLVNNDSLGSFLTLTCENHPEKITLIQSAKDFSKVPQGGCELPCNKQMSCGHVCPLECHGYDNEHETERTRCEVKCERVLCDLGHICPRRCWEACGPCRRPVDKTLPSCGHTMRVPCHVQPDDTDLKCTKILNVASPICGHEVEKLCHQGMFEARCTLPCTRRVPECGHECSLMCHGFDTSDMENAATMRRLLVFECRCGEPCTGVKAGCSLTEDYTGDRLAHQCPNKCGEPCAPCTVNIYKKRSNCNHFEKVACYVDVDQKKCKKMVKKTIPDCGHEIKLPCMKAATLKMCRKKCERTLSCGHKCTQRCATICDDAKCMQPCNKLLLCGHICTGTCAKCYQSRTHLLCRHCDY